MAGEGDAERLVTLFEARFKDFEKAQARIERTTNSFAKMRRGARTATQQMERDVTRSTTRINAALASTSTRIGSAFPNMVRGGLGMAGIGLSAAAIVNLTSTWSDLNSQVSNAVGEMRDGSEVMGRLSDMARRTYSSLTQTVQSFTDNSLALSELGYNTTQQLDLTEALNNAMVITGARGQQAESVMRAWSQAMALGELRGDNLNTVIQSGGRLAKALADSMGVSTNELRKLGAEGQITARDMFGVTRELETLREEADAMPATLTDSFVLLGNGLMQFVGQVDTATGATSFLAAEIIQLADDIEQAAQRWRDGEVPILEFAQAVIGMGRELGLVQDEIDDTRTEVERMDDGVDEARQRVIDFAAEIAIMQNVRDFAPHLPGEIERIIDKLLLGEATAEETRAALIDLGTANPNFGALIGLLSGLVGQMNSVRAAADEMYAAINTPGGPTGEGAGRGGAGASRRALIERQGIGSDYIAEQERLLGLSREQLAVEQAVAQIKKDVAEAGGLITDQEAQRLAIQQVAAANAQRGGRNSAAEQAKREAEAVAQLIDDLEFELSIIGLSNVEQAKANALRQAGAAATEEQRQKIEGLVEQLHAEQAQVDQMTELYSQMGQVGVTAFQGIADALKDGKIEASELNDILSNILSQMLNYGINLAVGGIGRGLGLPGFATGTANTGGQKGEIRGVVHGQEAVIPLPSGGKVPVQIAGGAGQAPVFHLEIVNETGGQIEKRDVTAERNGSGGFNMRAVIAGETMAAFGDGSMDGMMNRLYGLKRRGAR